MAALGPQLAQLKPNETPAQPPQSHLHTHTHTYHGLPPVAAKPDSVLTEKEEELEAYDEHIMQLAAYREGLGMPEARCANLFVSRTVPGLVKIIEHSEEDIKKGFEMFTHLLKYWQLSKGYQ